MITREQIEKLVEGKLSTDEIRAAQNESQKADRFELYIQVLQSKVPWTEKIVLPIHEHLFIVQTCLRLPVPSGRQTGATHRQKDGALIVKAFCGHEFGDYRENWKLKCLMICRDTDEAYAEIINAPAKPDPQYCQYREFICPGCGELLDVEANAPGMPISFEFLPDIHAFYSEWLGKQPPEGTPIEAEDKTCSFIRQWNEQNHI